MSADSHITPVLDRARRAFAAEFGREPLFAAAAPGRVNLIGEHTDYNGGWVMPLAIDRVCVAVASSSATGVSRVLAVELGQRGVLDLSAGLTASDVPGMASGASAVQRGSWISYVAGVMEGWRRLGRPLPNLDIAVASSVPVGSGLSSSASLEVAVATLLEAATGESLGPVEKVLLCQRAEHEFAGVPCGIMDQFVSVVGRRGHALLIDCRGLAAEYVPLPPPDTASVLIMDTHIRHELAFGEYVKRKATCAAAAAKLGVAELRDMDTAGFHERAGNASLTEEERRCARHVVTENARTLAAARALRAGDLPRLGQLMLESHASLRDDYRVSCAELDTLVDAAAGCPGVFGARMTGGGFGGCAIAVVDAASTREVQSRVESAYHDRHGRSASTAVVCATDGSMNLAP